MTLRDGEALVYRGYKIDQGVLDAIVEGAGKRILWAFSRRGAEIVAVPYSEDEVIWLSKD